MGSNKKNSNYFTKGELILWFFSMSLIISSFLIFDRGNYLSLIASLIGGTSLIFLAKGNPIAHVMVIIFSILYGIISYSCAYYGEMITYLGMTAPMAVIALISWLKNPFEGNKAEVKVNKIGIKDVFVMIVLTSIVTVIFYFILQALNTANIIPSTISVATSFCAVYLTFKRSPYYAVGYIANDVVLIILWVMATVKDITYVSVVSCFIVFLINDINGFISWQKRYKKQNEKLI